MSAVQLKRLETKINRKIDALTKLVKILVARDVVEVEIAAEGNRTDRSAQYLGLRPATLATWRATTPDPGPKFTYLNTTPVYSKKDLDEWLANRQATGKKRKAGIDVGRPVGTGKKRAVRP